MPKYIFLDTNIYLHYQPVKDLNLCRFGDNCILVVPRVIFGELNKHKDSHNSKKIMERARSIGKKIHQWSDDKKVNSSLGFEFIIKTSSPEKYGLDPVSCDDRFLADILEHEACIEDKILLSNDFNLCLTAKHLKIKVEEVDDKFKLPVEPDSTEKEIKKLRRELERLKNALPKLEVGLVLCETEIESNPIFRYNSSTKATTDQEINHSVDEIIQRVNSASLSVKKPISVIRHDKISQEDIDEYIEKLTEYPNIYREYLVEKRTFEQKVKFKFIIAIVNIGTAPAKNIDIRFHFPDGFELYSKVDIPVVPQEPSFPEKPLTMVQKMLQPARGFNINSLVPRSYSSSERPSAFSIEKTHSYDVEDSFSVIKHNEREELPELCLMFNNIGEVKSFKCEYNMTVDNLPDKIAGSINFRFQESEE